MLVAGGYVRYALDKQSTAGPYSSRSGAWEVHQGGEGGIGPKAGMGANWT